MTGLTKKLLLYTRGILGLRPEDTLLASFPRSGSTWVRFFLCNLIALKEMGGRVVDFPLLDRTMVELGVNDLQPEWPHSTVPRVVKTHRPYSRLYSKAGRAILIVRDPRDVVVSYHHYEQGKARPRFRGDLATFLRHPRFGLDAWIRHYRSWAPRADHTIRYEELVSDPRGTFDSLLDFLGVEIDEQVVAEALERSRFRSVRSVEESRGHTRDEVFREGFRFARRGGTGGWREQLSADDRAYYATLHRRYGLEIYPP